MTLIAAALTAGDWVLFAAGALLFGGGGWRAKQIWRDETSDLDGLPVGLLRSMPVMMVTITVFLGAGCYLAAFATPGPESSPLDVVLTLAAFAALIVGVPLTVLTAATGRPARLVPPHLRDERAPRARRRGGSRR